MCTRRCKCNLCYKKDTCTDCQYISEHEDIDCTVNGITECEHFVEKVKPCK